METDIIKKYKKAGEVWRKAIDFSKKKTKEGIKLLDLADQIEKLIIDEELSVAFPTNLSINEQAAHFTPKWNDTYELKESDLLKIDIGVCCEGYICDGAITINLDNKHAKQIEANELALENGLKKLNYGNRIDLVGEEIEKTLKEKGFNPIYNLGGHGLDRYDIHSAPSMPNHSGSSTAKLEEGVIALEPFSSTGKGYVGEEVNVEIFMVQKKFGVRNNNARAMLKLTEEYNGLPFAERWLRRKAKMDEFAFNSGLKELMKSGCIKCFPGLKESKGTLVTQVEKTAIVLEDKTIILGE